MKAGTAIITGAASGIGLAMAKASARRGYAVWGLDFNKDGQDILSAHIADARFSHLDVSNQEQVAAAAREIISQAPNIRLLFNNAGIMIPGRVWEQSPEHFAKVLNVNLMGAFYILRHFVPHLIEQNTPAHIVNTASLAGLIPSPLFGAYNAAKHGLVGLSETLLYEVQMQKAPITVSLLAPGPVATPIMQAAKHETAEDSTQALLDHLHSNMQEIGLSPDEIAEAAFAAIDRGEYWIFPHPEQIDRIQKRAASMSNPAPPQFEPW